MALDEISKSIGRIALSREKSKELGREMYYAGMLLDVEVLVGYYLLSALFIGLLATMLLFWWPGIFSTFESLSK